MGLQLNKDLPSGVSGDYHRVVSFSWSAESGIRMKVALYKSQQDRTDGKEPIQYNHFDCINGIDIGGDPISNFDDADLEDNYILALCYSKLKEEDYFDGAIDV